MTVIITDEMVQFALNAGRWHGPGGISAATVRAVLGAVAPLIRARALQEAEQLIAAWDAQGHGCLPVDPFEASAQTARELAGAIRHLRETTQ